MKMENEPALRRLPIYVAVSALAVAVSIGVVCYVVSGSGGAMYESANDMPQVTGVGNELEVAAQQARRSVSGGILIFLFFLWFVAPAIASYIAIKVSTAILDFNNRRWKIAFRLITLTLVLVAIWFLVPWSNAKAHDLFETTGIIVLRCLYLVINFVVALVLTRKSLRRACR